LNQNTIPGTDGWKLKPITAHTFVSKVTCMLEFHLELSKNNNFKFNQNTSAITGNGKLEPITSHSFVSKVTNMLEHHPQLSKKIITS
jgi:hypothetical protein